MQMKRRRLLQSACLAAAGSIHAPKALAAPDAAALDEAASRPLLNLTGLNEPITIRSIELFRFGSDHLLKTTAEDGRIGLSVTNDRAFELYPILERRVAPFFIGKDARDLESLIDGVYVHKSNCKLQNLALWCCVAWIEMSLLDLLGRASNRRLGDLFGKVRREELPVYYASGNRHTSPEEEMEILKEKIDQHGVHAIKFKVGGRMSNNADSIPGRSEALIPLLRKGLGDDIAIHADSNGSYAPPKAIDIGRRLEDIDAVFFEEPCPFDHLEDTKRVADALEIDIAGGECESSHRRFRWMIENQAVQVVQPDLHYYGGFIRSMRVANMAAMVGMPTTLHMGGSGVGFVETVQFASCALKVGPYQEFKESFHKTKNWYDPPLRMQNGAVSVPRGAGLGLSHAFLLDQKLEPRLSVS